MCLNLSEKYKLQIAKRDIVTYKVVKITNERYFTPYLSYRVELGGLYSSSLKTVMNFFGRDVCTIGIHSFRTLRDAKKLRKMEEVNSGTRMGIVRCVIPKNGCYYTGHFAGLDGYASDTIKYGDTIITYVSPHT